MSHLMIRLGGMTAAGWIFSALLATQPCSAAIVTAIATDPDVTVVRVDQDAPWAFFHWSSPHRANEHGSPRIRLRWRHLRRMNRW